MITSKEAKRVSDSNNTQSNISILKTIETKIQEAINVGDYYAYYYAYYYENLPTSVREDLEKLGYQMNDLIGKKFKRNKYGLSIWTKVVNSVEYDSCIVKIEDDYYTKKVPRVTEELEPPYHWYYLDEIVFISEETKLWSKFNKEYFKSE